MNRSPAAGKRPPHFRQTLHELLDPCSKIKNPTPLKEDHNVGFMALAFFGGQEAILILTERGRPNRT